MLGENKKKLNEVELNLISQKKLMNKLELAYKCDECEKTFAKKQDRRTHIQQCHPKFINCDLCDKVFNESWQYEPHLKSHSIAKNNNCDVCGRYFFLE